MARVTYNTSHSVLLYPSLPSPFPSPCFPVPPSLSFSSQVIPVFPTHFFFSLPTLFLSLHCRSRLRAPCCMDTPSPAQHRPAFIKNAPFSIFLFLFLSVRQHLRANNFPNDKIIYRIVDRQGKRERERRREAQDKDMKKTKRKRQSQPNCSVFSFSLAVRSVKGQQKE